MSKKNSPEQKKLRREERELHKRVMQENLDLEVQEIKALYLELHKKNFKVEGKFVDKARLVKLLEDRIAKSKAQEFIKDVEDGKFVVVDLGE